MPYIYLIPESMKLHHHWVGKKNENVSGRAVPVSPWHLCAHMLRCINPFGPVISRWRPGWMNGFQWELWMIMEESLRNEMTIVHDVHDLDEIWDFHDFDETSSSRFLGWVFFCFFLRGLKSSNKETSDSRPRDSREMFPGRIHPHHKSWLYPICLFDKEN